MLNINTKLQVKSNSNLTKLCSMHSKNIPCTIIKKGTVGVVYLEDKKGSSQFEQTMLQWMHLCGAFLSQPSLNFCNLYENF